MEETSYFTNLAERAKENHEGSLNLNISFPSLYKFYSETDIIDYKEQDGDYTWYELDTSIEENWVGLSREEILKSKFTYIKGLDKLKTIKDDIFLGGTKKIYKWDEFDGDDMNYDRYIDGFPAMKKRLRANGANTGRFITIHVSLSEHCGVGFKEMLTKSYTVMRLVDYLESRGYRLAVTVYWDVRGLGFHNNKIINKLHVEVPIKLAGDPLIKGQILTCISPWMLRYHMFKLAGAKFKTRWGLGQPDYEKYPSSLSDIYFNSGECLFHKDAEDKLKEVIGIYTKQ